ncbi:hypothetical protein [Alteribacillus iranensis]|uniref:Uncharacterized protein n=1 Tax=Alteribacillus iranensis TaxID=930128 RepID=A0A1I2FJP4_9BACI|nr:hypothetical protein [Alteribacillus iranensis]SFF04736.1 hypothetical protein SAMN05192532_11233 [Alteribacillus iranensis]
MNWKRFVYKIVCVGIIGFFLLSGSKYQVYLKDVAGATFEVLPVTIFSVVFPILIGVLLRLPQLLLEIKEKREWTCNWIKLLVVGAPALYVTSLPLLMYLPGGMNFWLVYEAMIVGNGTITTTVTGLVFGYVLLDSWIEK